MKHLFLILFLLGSTLFGQFDNVGTSAANFLKIGVGGRATGMGGAITANVNDPSSLYWNPAGTANAENIEVMVNITDWILDFKHNYFAVVFPGGRIGNFGLSVNFLDMGEMERTTELEPEGDGTTFSATNTALGLAFSKHMSDRFNVGVQLKMVQESISFTSASAFAIDAGSQYISRFSGLRIGMAITNFGTKMRLNGTDQKIDIDPFEELDGNPDVIANLRTEDWPLPMAFRFGFSIQPLGPESIIKNPLFVVMVNADYYDGRDLSPYYAIGTELKVKNLLYLRSGLKREFLRYEDSINNASIEELNNPENSGFFSYKRRRLAISLFMFGWLVLWIMLIIVGTFLRGPNWNFFGPFEYWDIHKLEALTNINFSEIIYIKWLNTGLPDSILLREIWGILIVLGYFLILPPLLAKTVLKGMYARLGVARYSVFIVLIIIALTLPIKMYLRWIFNLKYIISIPEYFFNF